MSGQAHTAGVSAGRGAVALAWAGVLAASAAPTVVWRQLAPAEPPTPTWPPAVVGAQVGGLALLWLAAGLWPAARPVRRTLLVLLAFLAGWRLLTPPVFEGPGWLGWERGLPVGVSLAASRLQWAFPVALMTLVVLGSGLRRNDLFLARGDWAAPVRPGVLFPFRGLTWGRAAVFAVLLTAAAVPAALVFTAGADAGRAGRVAAHLPGILAAAALNAACEEYVFRAVPLAVLLPAVGARQAVWLTAVLFGLEHWYGQPAGPVGVLLTTLWGWWAAKSMIETGGCAWAWATHFAGDVLIYSFVATARP